MQIVSTVQDLVINCAQLCDYTECGGRATLLHYTPYRPCRKITVFCTRPALRRTKHKGTFHVKSFLTFLFSHYLVPIDSFSRCQKVHHAPVPSVFSAAVVWHASAFLASSFTCPVPAPLPFYLGSSAFNLATNACDPSSDRETVVGRSSAGP